MILQRKLTLLFVIFFFSGILIVQSSRVQAGFFDFIKALVTINPLDVEVSAPAEEELGKAFKIEATIVNKGDVKIENITAEIFLSAGLRLERKDEFEQINRLQGGKSRIVFWFVKGTDIGFHSASVSAKAEVGGDIVDADGNTVIVEIHEELPPPGQSRGIFESFLNFFRRSFGF